MAKGSDTGDFIGGSGSKVEVPSTCQACWAGQVLGTSVSTEGVPFWPQFPRALAGLGPDSIEVRPEARLSLKTLLEHQITLGGD